MALYPTWNTGIASNFPVQGWFGFGRPDGNSTNLPFDYSINTSPQTVGHADWAAGAPTAQRIVLHINDLNECAALYPDKTFDENNSTCFVRPSSEEENPPPSCPGDTPACKQVLITDADGNLVDPNHLQLFTNYFLEYTYIIANPTSGPFATLLDMQFYIPSNKTQDVNAGGGKDYFGCEQIPDPSGSPGGGFKVYPNWLAGPNGGTFQLDFKQGSGTCNQSRFFLTVDPTSTSPVLLHPGDAMTFDIDMMLRKNKGGKQEYTSCGEHYLNSGFTIKWFWAGNPTLQSYSTNVTPLTVNVDCPQ